MARWVVVQRGCSRMGKFGGSSFFDDSNFQDELLQFVVNDLQFLKQASHLLSEDDFKRLSAKEGPERQTVAQLALNFWNRYRQPVGTYLKSELLQYARNRKWDAEHPTRQRLLDYAEIFSNGHKRVAADAMLDKVRQYKADHELALAMTQMQEMIENGSLTPEQFLAIARKAVEQSETKDDRPKDYFDDQELELRLARRLLQMSRQRFPVLLIEPIDRQVRIIARKHLGLIMAPYKRGKSLFFVWLALAYTLQRLNVLYFTLEDPIEDVEDRFDAAVTALPLQRLAELPDYIRERFRRYKRLLRTRLKLVDGTEGGISIQAVENIWEQERNRGFTADVIIVDYDDEVRPRVKRDERRMEFADIYKDYRAVLARHELIGWTASQTGRQTSEMKIISGKHIAEDISKIRKASFAMSLGAGEWGDDSIFLWIAAHRYDRQNVGANIITDKERMIFFDRDQTLKREKLEALKPRVVTP